MKPLRSTRSPKRFVDILRFSEACCDWRLLVCGCILAIAVLPTLWLIFSTFDSRSFTSVLTGPFRGALKRTVLLFTSVIAGALVLGWPAGTLMGLVPFRGQRLLFAALAVPLFTPSSLWAVGLSLARPWFTYRHQWWLDGFCGVLLSGLVQALPLVLLASALLVRIIPGSQLDSTLLTNGWRALLLASARFSLPAALAAAVLGGLIAIADPGPGQIMGYHGIASEILIALAARYDAGLAARKAIWLTLVLLPCLMPIAWWISTWSESYFFGRDLRKTRPKLFGLWPWVIIVFSLPAIVLLLSAPIAGFARAVQAAHFSQSLEYAWGVLNQSAATTIRYSLIAGTFASLMAFVLTLAGGGKHQGRFLLLLFCFIFLTVPAALHALGFAGIVSKLPVSFDPLTRQGDAPGLAGAFRWLPIPTLLCLRTWSLVPESAHYSAALHGVPWFQYHLRVTLPNLLPALFYGLVLVGLATAADISSTLILLPPGAATFATRIFGVLDSTTERTLSAFCLVYIAAGFIVLALATYLRPPVRRA